jgi:hypothetical protein
MELEKNALSSLSLCHYGETENPSIIIWLKYPISFPFECRCAAVCSLSCALKDAIRVRQYSLRWSLGTDISYWNRGRRCFDTSYISGTYCTFELNIHIIAKQQNVQFIETIIVGAMNATRFFIETQHRVPIIIRGFIRFLATHRSHGLLCYKSKLTTFF